MTTITKQAFLEAIAAIQATGHAPTYARIAEYLHCSNSTIKPLMQEFREEQAFGISSASVQTAAANLVHAIASDEETMIAPKIAELESKLADAESAKSRLDKELSDARLIIARMESERAATREIFEVVALLQKSLWDMGARLAQLEARNAQGTLWTPETPNQVPWSFVREVAESRWLDRLGNDSPTH